MKMNPAILRRGFLLAPFATLAYGGSSIIETHRRENVLGTSLELLVDGEAAGALNACLYEIERLRRILSTYDENSVISEWMRSGESGAIPVELKEVLRAYEHWSEASGGAIAAKLDGKWNVNALGKSYIVERALEAARRAAPKARGLLLNIGGDIAATGSAWRIGVCDPGRWQENAEKLTELVLADGAVATSGGYERGAAHLIDPRIGQTARGAASATVVARDAVTANALSTALCVLGREQGRRLVESVPGAECLVVERNGDVWRSSAFARLERPIEMRPAAAPALWPKGQQLTITLTLKTIEGYRVRRPYVAVWAEDLSGKLVRNITVWTEKRRWLPDLFEWWKKSGSNGGGASVTRATRAPGRYQLLWDGLDDAGQPLPEGKYRLVVETNREHGSYAKESGVIECGAKPATMVLQETGEFEAVTLSYGAAGQEA